MAKKLILIGIIALSFLGLGAAQLEAKPAKPRKVAVQTYSLNRFTVEEAIEKLKGLGLDGIECYPGQKVSNSMPDQKMGPEMSAQAKEFVKKLLKDANLKIVSFGVMGVGDNENEVKKICEFANEFGIEKIMTESPVKSLENWEKYSEKYGGIILCVHNHGKSSSNQYWEPTVNALFTKGKKYVKSCPDVGHWQRNDVNVMQGLKTLKGSIGSIHFKDVDAQGRDVPYGEGVMDAKAMLKELDSQKYDGYFVIEYEAEWDNNIPSIKKCVEFLRNN